MASKIMRVDSSKLFLLGYVKYLNYTDKPASITSQEANIERVIGEIPSKFLGEKKKWLKIAPFELIS